MQHDNWAFYHWLEVVLTKRSWLEGFGSETAHLCLHHCTSLSWRCNDGLSAASTTRLKQVGQLVDAAAPGCRLIAQYTREAAERLRLTFVPLHVSNRGEVESGFARLRSSPPAALLPC